MAGVQHHRWQNPEGLDLSNDDVRSMLYSNGAIAKGGDAIVAPKLEGKVTYGAGADGTDEFEFAGELSLKDRPFLVGSSNVN